ncbi:hypothetical protein AV654_10395 [Paenibacillus elgii]|uniref:PABS domain-containing protein n=1 Tax=Paenibacillus elgii TaxID=189691 RepID=A0A161UST5_9BACL|nr:hypothetical protein [Paenibacillus elgii]KZE80761.1 hypothetical protein AV654_10395 [Paenibacillus elgii]
MRSALYSHKDFLFNTTETLIAGDRIFVGNQQDEFALGGLLNKGDRILLLGLGYGGSLRSLLIGNQNVEITAIDYNLNSLNACKLLMDDIFPTLNRKIRYIHGNAAHFSDLIDGKFDVICIDLYNSTGYPEFVFNHAYWEMVFESLHDTGILLINSWGLPTHLSPLKGKTVHIRLLQSLSNTFKRVYALPYRRCTTFILSKKLVKPKINNFKITNNVCELDGIILNLFPLRWSHADLITIPSIDCSLVSGEQNKIYSELELRWEVFLKNLNSALKECGYKKIENNELKQFVYDPIRATEVTELLLLQSKPEAFFIPVAIGTYAFYDSAGLEWYINWILTRGEKLIRLNEKWFINIILWQCLALMTNPFTKCSNRINDIDFWIRNKLLNEDKLKNTRHLTRIK